MHVKCNMHMGPRPQIAIKIIKKNCNALLSIKHELEMQ